MSKYGNKKAIIDGITFDSKGEGKRYVELKILERAGIITDLKLQFPLKFVFCGKPIFTYKADFKYFHKGKETIDEYKGLRTAVFNLKWKIIQLAFPQYEYILTFKNKKKNGVRKR